MPNEHDIRYKKLFSNPTLVMELLTSFVHEKFINKLDFDSLEKVDKSFITDNFKEKESDLIYKINFKDKEVYIYMLMEFQSSVDKFMSLRILRYILEFYDYLSCTKRIEKLPAVFPILLYNGNDKWTAKDNIRELIIQSIPDEYIPDFKYYKIIENEISKEALLKIKNALSMIFYIENSNPEELKKEVKNLVKLVEKEDSNVIELIKNWFNNLLGDESNYINKEIANIEEVSEMFTITLEKYAKKLKDEGKIEGKIEDAKRMKQDGMPLEKISKYTGLSIEEISKL